MKLAIAFVAGFIVPTLLAIAAVASEADQLSIKGGAAPKAALEVHISAVVTANDAIGTRQ